MFLTLSEEMRFFRILLALAEYANKELNVLGHPFDQSPTNIRYDKELMSILDQIWAHDTIIERFHKENPSGLSRQDLGAIAQWKHALHGDFILFEHENGYSLFMVDDVVYAVIGLSQEISSMITETPCFVKTTLLPFEGHIVYDSKIRSYPIGMTQRAIDMLNESYQKTKALGKVYKSAEAFIRNTEYHREEAHQRELNKKIEEYRSANRKEVPSYDMPEGMHKGRLSGLSFEEREKLIEEEVEALDFGLNDGAEERLQDILKTLPTGTPVTSIEDALKATPKDRLMELARILDIKGYRRLSKPNLVKQLKDNTELFEDFINAYYLDADNRKFGLFEDLMTHDGTITRLVSEITENDLLQHTPPFIFHYLNGEYITTRVADEFVEFYKAADLDEFLSRRIRRKRICNCAESFIDLYGLISIDEFYRLYISYYPEDTYELRELAAELLFALSSEAVFAGIWHDEDTWYALDDAVLGDGSLFKTMYVCDLSLVNDDEDEDLDWFGFEDEDDEDDEADVDTDGVEDENDDEFESERKEATDKIRSYLLERHAMIPRKLLSREELEGFDIDTYIRSIPEVQEFLQFFDSYVPDSSDDLFFADDILTIVSQGVNFEAPLDYYMKILEDEGFVFGCIEHANDFMGVLSRAISVLPRWPNNGYSPKELHEMR